MAKPTTEELDKAQFGRALHRRPDEKPEPKYGRWPVLTPSGLS